MNDNEEKDILDDTMDISKEIVEDEISDEPTGGIAKENEVEMVQETTPLPIEQSISQTREEYREQTEKEENKKKGFCKNKKQCILICGGVALTIIIAVVAFFLLSGNKEEKEKEKPKNPELAEIKEYLAANYNKYVIDGSTSLIPLHQALEDTFGDKEEIKHKKTVTAFNEFTEGKIDILLSVEYSDSLYASAEAKGIKIDKKEITREAFVFLVNEENKVNNLTEAEIKSIYSGSVKKWNALGGENFVIEPIQRNEDSGSQMAMRRFMGDTKLMDPTVGDYTVVSMGGIVERLSSYDIYDAHPIAYNMYTFTEKQYLTWTDDQGKEHSNNVKMLNINGIAPTDETIFKGEYPLTMYNYIFYDENDAKVAEFVEYLYAYLMSDEGQELLSKAGYVNINKQLDRTYEFKIPTVEGGMYDHNYGDDKYITEIYNEKTDSYELKAFDSFGDFALSQAGIKSNTKLKNLFNTMHKNKYEAAGYVAEDKSFNGKKVKVLALNNYYFMTSEEPEYFCNYKYKNICYGDLAYDISGDKWYLLVHPYMSYGYEDEYTSPWDYISEMETVYGPRPTADIQVTWDELKNVSARTFDVTKETTIMVKYDDEDGENEYEATLYTYKYITPFK